MTATATAISISRPKAVSALAAVRRIDEQVLFAQSQRDALAEGQQAHPSGWEGVSGRRAPGPSRLSDH